MSYNTWDWARAEMKRARDKDKGKPLMKNQSTYVVVSNESPTWLREDGSWDDEDAIYALELWGTEIVRYYPNAVVAASLNGWNTVTTKKRIGDFSGFTLYSAEEQVFGGCGGRHWVGDAYTWFYAKNGRLVFKDGREPPTLMGVRKPKPIPKSRDTVARPLVGDAFEDGLGQWVCAIDMRKWPRAARLYHYLGDHPDDRSLFITDRSVPSRDLLSPVEMLAGALDGGLRAIERFEWQNPTKEEK
tara:strand:- start:194 stop:925 length:732 start_codon:yes stop_codon:yes gene_type:complete